MTKPNLFMSYSRREMPFVHALTRDLEAQGFEVWLDYLDLIPGTPWDVQINTGLDKSDVILLIASKESMASKYVTGEIERAKRDGKRVVLAVFESTELPDELQTLEWVDFRTHYEKGLAALVQQLTQPKSMSEAPPQRGFKAPLAVWAAFILSIPVAILSLGAIWTLILPYLLVPLPYRILKRNFNFIQINAALIALPLVLLLNMDFVVDDRLNNLTYASFFVAIPVALLLLWLLYSKSLRRWGKPIATPSKISKAYTGELPGNPEPVRFYIDHAPEDRKIAKTLREKLLEFGHPESAALDDADAVFVLVSRFKNDTNADPEHVVVYPVIVQSFDRISEKLQRVQWIDFRKGLHNLDALAKLLPNPAKLLEALAIRPMRQQGIVPNIIQTAQYFLISLMILSVGSFLPFIAQFMDDIIASADGDHFLYELAGGMLALMALTILGAHQLVKRHTLLASIPGLLILIAAVGAAIYVQDNAAGGVIETFITDSYDPRGLSTDYPIWLFLGGNLLMLLALLFNHRIFLNWLPIYTKKGTTQ